MTAPVWWKRDRGSAFTFRLEVAYVDMRKLTIQVEPGGYALVWNEDIDISEYELWKNGTSLQDTYDSVGDTPERSESDCLTS